MHAIYAPLLDWTAVAGGWINNLTQITKNNFVKNILKY